MTAKKNYRPVKCDVPQRSSLGPLLFILFVSNLQFALDLLDSIMFADDKNLFYSNKDINTVFLKVNNVLQKINEWFISNRLSLHVKKKANTSFSTNLAKNNIQIVKLTGTNQ